jgi:hypothetical protein
VFDDRDGERFIELIEVCYFDFCNQLLNMARNTTCRCSACAAIDSLDLKFVCHYGSFVVDTDAHGVDLAGPDVILVHRLLKNTVSESTNIEAYAFLTDACLQHLPPSLNLPRHEESYESFGVTGGGVHDLKPSIAAMQAARRHQRRGAGPTRLGMEVLVRPGSAPAMDMPTVQQEAGPDDAQRPRQDRSRRNHAL